MRRDLDFLTEAGEQYYRSSVASLLGRIAARQGKFDEALQFTRIAEEATAEDDVYSQAMWRAARAPLLARSGNLEMSLELARAAVEFSRRTETVVLQAEALAELSALLELAADRDAARAANAEALALNEAKGNAAAAARCRARASELGS